MEGLFFPFQVPSFLACESRREVSRGHSSRETSRSACAQQNGRRTQPMKDQTNEEPLDPMPGKLPITASWPGTASAWRGGKHGAVPVESGRNLDPTALRRPAQTKRNGQAGRLTSLTGTARCGAACRVVWEGWQAQSCHHDPIRIIFVLSIVGSYRRQHS